MALSSKDRRLAKKCRATRVQGSFVKLESGVCGFRSTWIRYMCVGTCVMSRIAAALVKLTCPDTSAGYREECGSVDAFFCCCSFAFASAVSVGGGGAMVG